MCVLQVFERVIMTAGMFYGSVTTDACLWSLSTELSVAVEMCLDWTLKNNIIWVFMKQNVHNKRTL